MTNPIDNKAGTNLSLANAGNIRNILYMHTYNLRTYTLLYCIHVYARTRARILTPSKTSHLTIPALVPVHYPTVLPRVWIDKKE